LWASVSMSKVYWELRVLLPWVPVCCGFIAPVFGSEIKK
jgi:hypothetical protein